MKKIYYNLLSCPPVRIGRNMLLLFIKYYRVVETLPLGYITRNRAISILIILGILSSFLLVTNFIFILDKFSYFNNILNFILVFFVFNVTFIKFNMVVKIYYFFLRGIPYFIKEFRNQKNKKILFYLLSIYLIKSILILLISMAVILRSPMLIQTFIDNVENGELIIIYSNLISVFLSLLYIDYVWEDEFKFRNPINGNIYLFIFSLLLYILGFYYLLNLFRHLELSNTIYCSDGGDESHFKNYQLNENKQKNINGSLSPHPIRTGGEENTSSLSDNVTESDIQRNMSRQENLNNGISAPSLQTNINVQANESNNPRFHQEEPPHRTGRVVPIAHCTLPSVRAGSDGSVERTDRTSATIPGRVMTDIRNFVDNYGLNTNLFSETEETDTGYDSDATITPESLKANELGYDYRISKQLKMIKERTYNNIEQYNQKFSFWDMYAYYSRLTVKKEISLTEFKKLVYQLFINADKQSTSNNLIDSIYEFEYTVPARLLNKPIYYNGKYSVLFYLLDEYYVKYEQKYCYSINNFYKELVTDFSDYSIYRNENILPKILDGITLNHKEQFTNAYVEAYRYLYESLQALPSICKYDVDLVNYDPLFYVAKTGDYLYEDQIILESLSKGSTIVVDTSKYFNYFIVKMEILKRMSLLDNSILDDLPLAFSVYNSILSQCEDTIYYYDYFKGFVLKYRIPNGRIRIEITGCNSLTQLCQCTLTSDKDLIKYYNDLINQMKI